MASGNPVLLTDAVIPPDATAATPDTISGASTPAETFRVWDFDADTIEHLDFHGIMSNDYAGGGLTVRTPWSASIAISGALVWSGAIRAIKDDVDPLNVSHTYVYTDALPATAPSVLTEVGYVEFTFAPGTDMDNLLAGERFVLRMRRNRAAVGDNMLGDGELHFPSVRES